jgi:uncharacterized membrane protein
MDTELQRKNVRLGLLLLAVFVVFFGATIGVAFLYLQFD